MGKERVRETKIQGKIEGERRVGGKQEEGDHSEGKEEDPKIIRDGYAFAHERGREKERGKRGRGEQETVGDCPQFLHPTLRASSPRPCHFRSATVTSLSPHDRAAETDGAG